MGPWDKAPAGGLWHKETTDLPLQSDSFQTRLLQFFLRYKLLKFQITRLYQKAGKPLGGRGSVLP